MKKSKNVLKRETYNLQNRPGGVPRKKLNIVDRVVLNLGQAWGGMRLCHFSNTCSLHPLVWLAKLGSRRQHCTGDRQEFRLLCPWDLLHWSRSNVKLLRPLLLGQPHGRLPTDA